MVPNKSFPIKRKKGPEGIPVRSNEGGGNEGKEEREKRKGDHQKGK